MILTILIQWMLSTFLDESLSFLDKSCKLCAKHEFSSDSSPLDISAAFQLKKYGAFPSNGWLKRGGKWWSSISLEGSFQEDMPASTQWLWPRHPFFVEKIQTKLNWFEKKQNRCMFESEAKNAEGCPRLNGAHHIDRGGWKLKCKLSSRSVCC